MPVFPSKEWCEEAIRIANADPEAAQAGEGWVGDFGGVIEAESGKLAKPFVFYAAPNGGRIEKFKVLVDADDLDEFEPKYFLRGPYSIWKGLLQGALDPVEMVLKRKISVQGDLQPLIERLRFKGIAERLLQKLETKFVDEL